MMPFNVQEGASLCPAFLMFKQLMITILGRGPTYYHFTFKFFIPIG